jgi:prepilin-type processing-associated H-X9-DG protein
MGLKTYLLRMKGGGTLEQNADFAAIRKMVGPNASSIYYANTTDFVKETWGLLPFVVGLAKMAPPEVQPLLPDPALIPSPLLLAKHMFGSVAATRTMEDGILWESYSPFGLPTPPAIRQGGGIATMSILAGMLLPALGSARGEARKVRDMSNLAQIGKGAMMWALNNGDNQYFPPTLRSIWDAGIIDEPRVFLSPSANTVMEGEEFISDYEYIGDLLGRAFSEAEAKANMPLAWDKEGLLPDGRNVVFVDGHVEFIPEGQFQRMMEETILPWVEEMKKKPAPELKLPEPRPFRSMPMDERPLKRPVVPPVKAVPPVEKGDDF